MHAQKARELADKRRRTGTQAESMRGRMEHGAAQI